MSEKEIQSQYDPIHTKQSAKQDKSVFDQPECRGTFLIRYGKGTECAQCHNHHRHRAHQIGTDRRISDDQSAYDTDGSAERPRHPDPRLADQFKRQFHKQHFQEARKRHALPGLRKGQDQIRRKDHRVKSDHCQIRSGQQKGKYHRRIADQPLKRGNLESVIAILRHIHKVLKGTRKQ